MSDQRFNEVIVNALQEVTSRLLKEVPELDALSFVLCYHPSVGDAHPQYFTLSRDTSPQTTCRVLIQTTKLVSDAVGQLTQAAHGLLSEAQEMRDGNQPDPRTPGGQEESAAGDPPASGPADTSED